MMTMSTGVPRETGVRVADPAIRVAAPSMPTGSTTRSSTCWTRPSVQSSPVARRLLAILVQRGWQGWTRIERVPAERLGAAPTVES
jgi:hypothetical protein